MLTLELSDLTEFCGFLLLEQSSFDLLGKPVDQSGAGNSRASKWDFWQQMTPSMPRASRTCWAIPILCCFPILPSWFICFPQLLKRGFQIFQSLVLVMVRFSRFPSFSSRFFGGVHESAMTCCCGGRMAKVSTKAFAASIWLEGFLFFSPRNYAYTALRIASLRFFFVFFGCGKLPGIPGLVGSRACSSICIQWRISVAIRHDHHIRQVFADGSQILNLHGKGAQAAWVCFKHGELLVPRSN